MEYSMSFYDYDFNKTLKEVIGNSALDLNDDSNLVKKCTPIYNKKILREYSNEDLRLMIGQEIGLKILIPFALDILEENIFSEGELYAGDLLSAVSSINSKFWHENLEYKNRLVQLIEINIGKLNDIKDKL